MDLSRKQAHVSMYLLIWVFLIKNLSADYSKPMGHSRKKPFSPNQLKPGVCWKVTTWRSVVTDTEKVTNSVEVCPTLLYIWRYTSVFACGQSLMCNLPDHKECSVEWGTLHLQWIVKMHDTLNQHIATSP